MKEVYEIIAERLKEVEAVKWIDLWRNQTNSTEKEIPNAYPACFISIEDVQYEETHTRTKLANMQIAVYVVQEHYQDTHQGALDLNQDSLGFFDVLSDVENSLSNYQQGRLSALVLSRTQLIDNGTNLITYKITYQASCYQCK